MEVQVVRKGNNLNRLTVTMDRITLKLKNDVSPEQEENLKKFSVMVAQRTRPIFYKTMRGTFSSNLDSIEMQSTNRSRYSLYCLDELELEGLATDKIESSKKTEESRRNASTSTVYRPTVHNNGASAAGYNYPQYGGYGQYPGYDDYHGFVD